jgi:hypothetical protein
VRLHVGVLGAEERLGAIDGQGNPSAYLFVSGDPAASSTASDTKFSLAISSSPSACRSVSSRISLAISGSTSASGLSNESISSPSSARFAPANRAQWT